MVKFGFAIAGLLSGAIMSFVGFVPSSAVQPEMAVMGLRLFFSGFSILGTMYAIYVMMDYDVNEEKVNKFRAELERIRGQK
jgi:GPH family glycoside/pentoside/hexuronide:cation symporter